MVALSKSAVNDTLQFAATAMHPKLARLLVPGVGTASTGMSFHIQDGRVSHAKECDHEALIEPSSNGKPLPTPDDVLGIGLRRLKPKLETCLTGGYHGFVSLTFTIDRGSVSISCDSERVHKSPFRQT